MLAATSAARTPLCRGLAVMVWLRTAIGKIDLEEELYQEAKLSDQLTTLSPASVDDFIGLGQERPASNVMVMFHESGCPHCRRALPKFEQAAKRLKEQGIDIALAHVDCASHRNMLQRFHLPGFPTVLFWRALHYPALSRIPEALRGRRLQVGTDAELLLRASRAAGMSPEKHAKRLQCVGEAGTVVEVDTMDHTAKLDFGSFGLGKVWLPLEVLSFVDGEEGPGAQLPYERDEVAKQFRAERTGWEEWAITAFAKRMIGPIVLPLESRSELKKLMRNESEPALVFCGEETTHAFLELAALNQDVAQAYQAKSPAACPVEGPRPCLVVYAPAHQQWSAQASTAKAAVTVAGPDIVADDDELLKWAAHHKYPGLMRLGMSNFRHFVRAKRSGLIAAVDEQNRRAIESHRMVEERMLAVARPKEFAGYREFTYNDTAFFTGVVDGRLEGMATFNVMPYRLPRLLLTEGPDQWVEDEEEFRIEGLPADLEKVPRLWHTSEGVKGFFIVLMKLFLKFLSMFDGIGLRYGGEPGRLFVRANLIIGVSLQIFFVLKILISAFDSVATALFFPGDDSQDKDAKKD